MKPHLHFMGIGGVSMSGLALWYAADGAEVSGCDVAESPQVAILRDLGIEVEIGHSPDHLDGVHTLVHTMAVADQHPEVVAARTRGLRTVKRIELLGDLFGRRRAIAVTGTHGKSTTTGMLATALLALGDDPSVQIGANLPAIGGNARYGAGPDLVAEVDESDPGFADLHPDIAVITNVEDDHIAGDYEERRNYHASLADLEEATRSFASHARTVVACADWTDLPTLLREHPNMVTYGHATDADYRITELALGHHGSTFNVALPDGRTVSVALAVPGSYNAQNATAALAAAICAGLDPMETAAALGSFPGVGRRWQRWGEVRGALVIDDYAHHPTEVAATIEAARSLEPRRVVAAFQPHLFSRTAALWRGFGAALAAAELSVVLESYRARERPEDHGRWRAR
jgi:UDP-N-acetylmuramate--alanine ligase